MIRHWRGNAPLLGRSVLAESVCFCAFAIASVCLMPAAEAARFCDLVVLPVTGGLDGTLFSLAGASCTFTCTHIELMLLLELLA